MINEKERNNKEMKKFGELVEPKEVQITYGKDGEEVTDTFVISKIPGFNAHRIHAKMGHLAVRGNIGDMPEEISLELLKYAAHNQIVLDQAALVNVHCPTAEVVFYLAMEVFRYNFAFFDSKRFQDSMNDFRNMMGL